MPTGASGSSPPRSSASSKGSRRASELIRTCADYAASMQATNLPGALLWTRSFPCPADERVEFLPGSSIRYTDGLGRGELRWGGLGAVLAALHCGGQEFAAGSAADGGVGAWPSRDTARGASSSQPAWTA